MNLGQKIALNQFRVGPSMVAQWAHEHGEDFPRGEANKKILATLALHGMNVRDDASHDWSVEVSEHAAIHHAICMHDLSRARPGSVHGTLEDYEFYSLLPFLKLMVGFAFEMQTNPYPALRFYSAADSEECKEGVTRDFLAKHVSSTQDAKSARNTARVRATPREQRRVQAYGGIVTRRSGALTQDAAEQFTKEILTRQKEFARVYSGLMTLYERDAPHRCGDVQSVSDIHGFDSLEFETSRPYEMFEFEDAKGGRANRYIKFSLSSNSDGTKWAVHHLSGTFDAKGQVGPNCERVANLLGKDIDGTTTVRRIF